VRYITTQKYSECQLVAAINAFYFHGGREVTEEEYESLVDIVGARHGSAIDIGRAYRILGLKPFCIPPFYWILRLFLWLRFPVEVGMYHKRLGLHTILIAGGKGRKVLALNARLSPDEWVKWRDLKGAIRKGNKRNIGPSHGWFRVIRRIGVDKLYGMGEVKI